MMPPCPDMTADTTEDAGRTDKVKGRTDKVTACVLDMEVAYFPDKAKSGIGKHVASTKASPSEDRRYRLPCPTVCVSDTERPRTLPHRSADAKPCTDDPVEGASASDPVERSGPSDVNLRANGFCGMAQQNTTYWLDGKGLSPLMGGPIDCSKGVTSTGDESHSGLLPAHNNTAQPTCTPAQDMPKPPNYVPLSIGLLFIAPFCGVPCLVFALRAQRAHARGLEKVSRKNNDYAFMLLIMALMFLALVLLIYLVWQMTSALCLPLPSTVAPVTARGTSKYRQYPRQSKNGIDRLNHSQATMMPRFGSHDTMLHRPVKFKHDTSDRPPSGP